MLDVNDIDTTEIASLQIQLGVMNEVLAHATNKAHEALCQAQKEIKIVDKVQREHDELTLQLKRAQKKWKSAVYKKCHAIADETIAAHGDGLLDGAKNP